MTQSNEAISAEEMEDRLEEFIDAVLSSRRTAIGPARRLAQIDRSQQEFVLHWVRAISKTNAEMAYQFAAFATDALQCMDSEGVEAWIIQSMDSFDKKGLTEGIAKLHQPTEFARQRQQQSTGLALEDIKSVLQNFIQGLNGRPLKLDAGEAIYTDTETLYLPMHLSKLSTREGNFRLYKAMALHLWAQTWYGTWWIDPLSLSMDFFNKDKALLIYHALELIRLDARIAQELPGVYREMQALRATLDTQGYPQSWAFAKRLLRSASATAKESWSLVSELYSGPVPQPCCYQGQLFPQRVHAVVEARKQREKSGFRLILAKLHEELDRGRTEDPAKSAEDLETNAAEPQTRFTTHWVAARDPAEGFTQEIYFEDKPISPPDALRGVMASIIQDLGEIPDDYLMPAGQGSYAPEWQAQAPDPNDVWKGTYHEEGALLYNEWDCARRHYRKNWCVLRERDVHPQTTAFISHTLFKYRGLVKSLRRSFEALRGEQKLQKKQPHGDDVDIDALVEAYADLSSGLEMSNRLFIKLQKDERDIAVAFMVDMSGSTKGWINTAEREALVLLCEALQTLGDRYAIYGFSGMTRKRCELFRIKRFNEPYNDEVRARICGILPQDYTRMGVAIRHVTQLLAQQDARTKLLVTLSDGKPDDYTDYRGEYGIEDTRQALFEARREGIHPFCITIDDEAGDYLSHMYGAVNYVVIDDVRKLPLKVSEIYRRLTS
jgi:nitric oxide reductase NorD protein